MVRELRNMVKAALRGIDPVFGNKMDLGIFDSVELAKSVMESRKLSTGRRDEKLYIQPIGVKKEDWKYYL